MHYLLNMLKHHAILILRGEISGFLNSTSHSVTSYRINLTVLQLIFRQIYRCLYSFQVAQIKYFFENLKAMLSLQRVLLNKITSLKFPWKLQYCREQIYSPNNHLPSLKHLTEYYELRGEISPVLKKKEEKITTL